MVKTHSPASELAGVLSALRLGSFWLVRLLHLPASRQGSEESGYGRAAGSSSWISAIHHFDSANCSRRSTCGQPSTSAVASSTCVETCSLGEPGSGLLRTAAVDFLVHPGEARAGRPA